MSGKWARPFVEMQPDGVTPRTRWVALTRDWRADALIDPATARKLAAELLAAANEADLAAVGRAVPPRTVAVDLLEDALAGAALSFAAAVDEAPQDTGTSADVDRTWVELVSAARALTEAEDGDDPTLPDGWTEHAEVPRGHKAARGPITDQKGTREAYAFKEPGVGLCCVAVHRETCLDERVPVPEAVATWLLAPSPTDLQEGRPGNAPGPRRTISAGATPARSTTITVPRSMRPAVVNGIPWCSGPSCPSHEYRDDYGFCTILCYDNTGQPCLPAISIAHWRVHQMQCGSCGGIAHRVRLRSEVVAFCRACGIIDDPEHAPKAPDRQVPPTPAELGITDDPLSSGEWQDLETALDGLDAALGPEHVEPVVSTITEGQADHV